MRLTNLAAASLLIAALPVLPQTALASSYSKEALAPAARTLIAEVEKYGAGDPSRDPEGDLLKLADLRKRVEANGTVPAEARGNMESAFGAAHFYSRRYAKAVEYYNVAAALFEEGKAAPSELAGLYSNIGTILSSLGRYDEAETSHRRALAIRESLEGKRGPAVASSLFGIGYVYYRTGRIEESLPFLRESVSQQLEFLKPANPLIVVRMTSLASVLGRSGREAEGLEVARRAEEIGRKQLGEKHPTYAIALHNLGTALIEAGSYEEAIPMLREALRVRINTIGEKASGTALSLRNLATALKKTGAMDEAEELTRRAAEIFARSGETDTPQALAYLYNELADLSARRGDWAKYDQWEQKSRDEADKKLADTNFERAHIHLYHAEKLAERGNFSEALPIAERWVPVMQKALIAGHKDRIWAELLLARLRQQASGGAASWTLADGAIAQLSAKLGDMAVTDRQLVREAETNRQSALIYFDAAMAAGDQERAFTALQLTNITDLALGQQFASDNDPKNATESATLRRNLLELGRRIDQLRGQHIIALEAHQNDKATALETQLVELGKQKAIAEADLNKRFPDFVQRYRPAPISLAQFRTTLTPQDHLLAPVEAPSRNTIVTITRDGMTWHQAAYTKQVASLRAAVDDPAADLEKYPFAEASAIYRQLFPRGLKRGSRILFHGGGSLASLPLSLLVTRDYSGSLRDAPWLVRDASFQVIGNLALRLNPAKHVRRQGNPVVAGIGGVDLPPTTTPGERRPQLAGLFRSGRPAMRSISELPDLPNAAGELRQIADALPGNQDMLLIGADAREERIKAADLSKANIIAFATHGLVADDVRGLWEPALLLGTSGPDSGEDGLLGASEIARLNLDADWVILSACNTSSGQSRGGPVYSGLATAFAQAGARALMLSHWQVRDDAAARLSVATVRGSGKGLGRAEALRRAQIGLLRDRKLSGAAHPAIWAPFVIVEN